MKKAPSAYNNFIFGLIECLENVATESYSSFSNIEA
jgi:hypothetical protein